MAKQRRQLKWIKQAQGQARSLGGDGAAHVVGGAPHMEPLVHGLAPPMGSACGASVEVVECVTVEDEERGPVSDTNRTGTRGNLGRHGTPIPVVLDLEQDAPVSHGTSDSLRSLPIGVLLWRSVGLECGG